MFLLLYFYISYLIMKTKDILIEMLGYLEKYENECTQNDASLNTTDFLAYVNTHHQSVGVKRDAVSGGREEWMSPDMQHSNATTDISILVTMMFRHAKLYIKKALKNSQIKTGDEFSFLITLLTHESMTKQELINMQVMEKTSGIEIIKRLINLGFIAQVKDVADKRSVRIAITPEGRRELIAVLPQMQRVSQIVAGNLNQAEKNLLAYTLRKLDHFHAGIFMNEKNSDLEVIAEKITIK